MLQPPAHVSKVVAAGTTDDTCRTRYHVSEEPYVVKGLPQVLKDCDQLEVWASYRQGF